MEQKPPGRLVLVYFNNPDSADNFVRDTPERVVGMYEDPKGRSCTCRSEPAKDYGLGEHHRFFGWQIHHFCGKAGKWWRRGYGRRLFLALGVNLLPRENTPEIFRSPEGWGHESYRPESEDR